MRVKCPSWFPKERHQHNLVRVALGREVSERARTARADTSEEAVALSQDPLRRFAKRLQLWTPDEDVNISDSDTLPTSQQPLRRFEYSLAGNPERELILSDSDSPPDSQATRLTISSSDVECVGEVGVIADTLDDGWHGDHGGGQGDAGKQLINLSYLIY